MTRRFKIALDVDDRTADMSDEALMCRTLGHKWERRARSRKRTLELLKNGLVEYARYCEHGCGCTWRQVWDIERRMVVENERYYPKNGAYLAPPNSGRITRSSAFPAFFARENPELV